MNLQQTLEKLAVLAGDWIRFDDTGDNWYTLTVPVLHIHKHSHIQDMFNPETLWFLFGAICEKVEAEGYKWTMPNDGVTEKYVCELWPQHKTGGDSICGYSDIHPAHAAALALLAALEAKVCVCNGTQQVRTVPNCDEGDFSVVMADCPFCTGK